MPSNEHSFDAIPVGPLGLIPMSNCSALGEKVNQYLVKWRHARQSEHTETLVFKGFERDTYIVNVQTPRFASLPNPSAAMTCISWWT